MNLVKGENISISINGEVIACWRSSTLQITADTIGKSTIGSGNWKEYEGNVLSWTVNGEGLLYMDADFTIHNAYDLMVQLANVFTVFTVDDGAIPQYYSGMAIITSIQQQGNVNDNGSFNISMQGTGELVRDIIATYGAAPEGLEIIEVLPDFPTVGFTRLSFLHDFATPSPEDYTIEIVDNTTAVTTYATSSGNVATIAVIVNSADDYTFRIRSNYFGGTAHSEWSASIDWP